MQDPSDFPAAVPPLRLNALAPDFTARTTMGERSLSDYRGRWLVLMSHPADFTPVCTSEFVALARQADAFAWLADIDRRYGVRIPFPVIEDPSMVIGAAYGMVDATSPDSATVRATFIIDPDGIVRAISWYPMTVGRSVDELLRLVTALQVTDREQASAPAGWTTGAPLMEPAAVTLDEALATEAGGQGWYTRERRS